MMKVLFKKRCFIFLCGLAFILFIELLRSLKSNCHLHTSSSSMLVAKESIDLRIFDSVHSFNKSGTDFKEPPIANEFNQNKNVQGSENISSEVQRAQYFLSDASSSVLETYDDAQKKVIPHSISKIEDDIKSLLSRFARKFCQMCSLHSNISLTEQRKTNVTIPSPNMKVTVLTDSSKMNESYFIPRPEIINNISYEFSLHNKSLCSSPSGKRPFLLIMVPSVKESAATRKVIRETWGSLVHNGGFWGNFVVHESVRLFFFLGASSLNSTDMREIKDEANQYGDVLLADFEDSYHNLSLKIVIGLSWINQYCDGVEYIVKVDEDTFLHVPKLVAALQHVPNKHESFVLGHRHAHSHPPVIRKGRWAVGPEYPMSSFPSYVYGHSYVVSGPAVKKILNAFQHMPLVANEDAYITGILSKAANVTRLSNYYFAIEYRMPMVCRVSDGHYISVTNCCHEHLQAIYQDVLHGSCDWRFQYSIESSGCRFFEYEDYYEET